MDQTNGLHPGIQLFRGGKDRLRRTKTLCEQQQGRLIQVHIPLLSNYKDTGEEPYSLHNRKHT